MDQTRSPSQAVPLCIREDIHTRLETHTPTSVAMSALLLLFYLSCGAFGGVFSCMYHFLPFPACGLVRI